MAENYFILQNSACGNFKKKISMRKSLAHTCMAAVITKVTMSN